MKMEEVGFCGLYCGLCASRRRIPREAATLHETLRNEGYDRGYFDDSELAEVFSAFWKGLNRLAEYPCAGCRSEGGYPGCPIRACAFVRGVDACPLCAAYPCDRLDMLRGYPLLLSDGRRMKEIGLERWVAEQEKRAAAGFCYADVRHPRE